MCVRARAGDRELNLNERLVFYRVKEVFNLKKQPQTEHLKCTLNHEWIWFLSVPEMGRREIQK